MRSVLTTMNNRTISILTTGALMALTFTINAQNRRGERSGSLNIDRNGPVADCSNLKVTFDRSPALTEESETSLTPGLVAVLKTQMSKGGAFIIGWDRNDYSIKTCKAVPNDDPSASSTMRDIV